VEAKTHKILNISLIAFLFLAFSVPVMTLISKKLSKTSPVDANILLVEGWMRPYAIEIATSEFKANHYLNIITTGLRTAEYFNEAMNGYMIFYSGNQFKQMKVSSKHTIEVSAFSEMEGENSAHFRLYVNDSLSADFLADKRERKYALTWTGALSQIDSIMVQFDNDKRWESGDRNLYLKELIIDHKYKIPYYANSVYEIRFRGRKVRYLINYNSYAELAKQRFISDGVDSSIVIAVPGERARINRTLTSATLLLYAYRPAGIGVKRSTRIAPSIDQTGSARSKI
jgi:hypothetical protein